MKNLATIIKENREKLKISQEDFAEKLNVSRQAVSKWENGLSIPSKNNLKDICKILEIEIPSDEEISMENEKNKKMIKKLIALCVKSFIMIILILVIAIVTNISLRDRKIDEDKILGVDFYSETGTKIESEALWYNLGFNSFIVVPYTGETPQTVTVYLTPTGTEVADKREQVKTIIPNYERKYVLIPFQFTETKMGHLEISFDYGGHSIFSDIYNVVYTEI